MTHSAISFQTVTWLGRRKKRKLLKEKMCSIRRRIGIHNNTMKTHTERVCVCVLVIKPKQQHTAYIHIYSWNQHLTSNAPSNCFQQSAVIVFDKCALAQKVENVFAHISSAFNGKQLHFLDLACIRSSVGPLLWTLLSVYVHLFLSTHCLPPSLSSLFQMYINRM